LFEFCKSFYDSPKKVPTKNEEEEEEEEKEDEEDWF